MFEKGKNWKPHTAGFTGMTNQMTELQKENKKLRLQNEKLKEEAIFYKNFLTEELRPMLEAAMEGESLLEEARDQSTLFCDCE